MDNYDFIVNLEGSRNFFITTLIYSRFTYAKRYEYGLNSGPCRNVNSTFYHIMENNYPRRTYLKITDGYLIISSVYTYLQGQIYNKNDSNKRRCRNRNIILKYYSFKAMVRMWNAMRDVQYSDDTFDKQMKEINQKADKLGKIIKAK